MRQSIEVVIPVHDPARPVARGIASATEQRSALATRGVDLHVTVVLHNLPADSLTRPGSPCPACAGVTYLAHTDGVASPAGPRNYALGRSSATYLSFLDSDDYLEPGSLLSWWQVAEKHAAAAVIAPLRTPVGQHSPVPANSTVKAPGPPPPPGRAGVPQRALRPVAPGEPARPGVWLHRGHPDRRRH